jgi:tripartite-type tricarboxylate transporter receptor subunit TctC
MPVPSLLSRRHAGGLLLAASLGLLAPSVLAQQSAWPTRPVTLVVPAAPGMAADVGARFVADKLSKQLGQQVLVDNKPGGAGIIGVNVVLGQPADGYTLLLMVSTYTIQAAMPTKPAYDVMKDFAHVAHMGLTPQMLVASPKAGINSLPELLAKARSDSLNSGSAGMGTTSHLTMEMIKHATGIKANHVPYKGTQDAQMALVNGDIAIGTDSVPANLPRIRNGQLKPIAVATSQRLPSLPDVPTFAELGYPALLSASWLAVSARAGTPAPILDRLNAEVRKALQDPEVRAKMDGLGFILLDQSREQFTAFVKGDLDKWERVIREAGVKLQ